MKQEISFFEASGFSMWPFLKPKEKLIVQRISADKLRTGDILLYKTGNQLICHRLIRKTRNNNGWILHTRGDASLFLSERVTEENLLGRISGIVKDGKIINMDGVRQRIINWLIVIIAPLIVLGMRAAKFLLRKK